MGDATLSEPRSWRRIQTRDLANASELLWRCTSLCTHFATVRIPLADFEGADLTHGGVRFTFDDSDRGPIYMIDIRISPISGRATTATPTSAWTQ